MVADSMAGGEMVTDWKPVVGYEGLYEVSYWGEVRAIARKSPKGKAIHARARRKSISTGYERVSLADRQGKVTKKFVHVLVAAAFIGVCPEGQIVRHWDGVKTNNHVSNLLYGTRKDNYEDDIRLGVRSRTIREYRIPDGWKHAF